MRYVLTAAPNVCSYTTVSLCQIIEIGRPSTKLLQKQKGAIF